MRWRCVFLALLVAASPAAAQEGFLQDAQGDEQAKLGGQDHDPPLDRYAHVDLIRLDWQEDPQRFSFVLEVDDLTPEEGALADGGTRYLIRFDFAGIAYAVEISRYPDVDDDATHHAALVALVEEDGRTYRNWRSEVDLTVDESTGTFHGAFERAAVTDSKGAKATAEDRLEGFVATAESFGVRVFGDTGLDYHVEDRMPDEGEGPAYAVVLGTAQSGDASLSSQDPYRLSNGGGTSLVYQIDAANAGDRQAFRLGAHDVPDGWTVSLPFDRLVLDEGETRTFPILVMTQSGHRHGGVEQFLVTLTGQRDESDVGRVEIGVKYTDVPQPAGHHPKLWIHAADPWGSASTPWGAAAPDVFTSLQPYMNTLEEDPGDVGQPVRSWYGSIPGLPSHHFWHVPLVPQLAMGLDFDVPGLATLSVPIEYDYVAQDATLAATLYYSAGDDAVALASSAPSAPVSWQQGTHTFEVDLDVHDDADFIPYHSDAWLWLEIQLEGTWLGPGPFGPGSTPRLAGGWMELPLNEYRDPVDTFYRAVESLRFGADYLERPVNPGKTLLFETHLRNAAASQEEVRLNLTGINAQWARILGDDSFTIGAGQERQIAVAVAVPADMPDGALADLVLQASSQRDSSIQAMISLIAIVDEEADHPDASHRVAALDQELEGDKKSPGFEIAAVALGLLALVLLRRRH